MGKNVAVFVDVANIFYAAKAAGVDIDYVTLLRSSTAGRDFVRAYAYTGLDPDNENQRNFHQFLARHNYKVVSKDIRKYGDGKVKANLDIELVVDMMKTARNLDVAVLVSGDGDFAPAIRAVQEMGVRVEVVSFRGNTSSDLIDVADLFTDITQIAKVEKGSTRSGRRVTEDDEDLSMTEVPDKQSEGAGESRGRGRGRTSTRGRGRETRDRDEAPVPVAASSRGSVTALPGEKLSKAAPAGEVEEPEIDEDVDGLVAAAPSDEGVDGDGRRRRRRRGGRGRGRGRAAEDGAPEGEEPVAAVPAAAGPLPTPFDDDEPEPGPRGPKPTPFGSVWDSQIGMPTARSGGELEPLGDEDEEPAIPEYLIAERRGGGNRTGAGGGAQRGGGGGRGGGGRGGGGRGGAYAAAIDRERYGRGGPISRYPEPARGGSGGGGGGGGNTGGRGGRDDRYGGGRGGDRDRDRGGYSRPAGGAARHSGGDPWSEVPPELEELVRAQLARSRPSGEARPIDADVPEQSAAPTPVDADTAPARRRTRRTAAADAPVAETAAAVDEAAPKRRTTRRTAPTETPAVAEDATEAPKRRTTTRRTAAATPAADAAEAPKATRTRRTPATAAAAETESSEAAPKRRTRKTAADSAEG